MLGLLWALVSVGLAFVLIDRLPTLVLIAATIWVLLPGLGTDPFAIGRIDLHPATLLVLMGFFAQWLLRPRRMAAVVERQPALSIVLTAVAILAPVSSYIATNATPSLVFGVDMVMAPIMVYSLLGAAMLEDPGVLGRMRVWFLTMAALESALALVQLAKQSTIFFSAEYAAQYWYDSSYDRWMGTFDHPLILSLFIVVALPLSAGIRRVWMQLLLIVLLMGGLLATQSRTGLVLAVIELLYIAVRGVGSLVGRGILLLLLVGLAGWAISSSLVSAALSRFTNDSGSASVRTQTLHWFGQHIGDTWWLGKGFGASFDTASAAGFGTSFEISFVMYTIDIGLVLSILYFGAMILATLQGLRPGSVRGPFMAGVAAVIVPQTFSALGVRSASAAILWLVFALAAFQTPGARRARAVAASTAAPRPLPTPRPAIAGAHAARKNAS